MQTTAGMELLIAALVWTLVGLMLLGLSAIAVPTTFELRGVFRTEIVDLEGEVRWAVGLLSVGLSPAEGVVVRLLGLRVYRYTGGGAPAARERRPAGARTHIQPRVLWRIARRVLRSLRLRARVAGRLGAGDPADTAYILLVIGLVRQACPGLDTRELRIDWVGPAVELAGQVHGRVWPLHIVWIAGSEWWRSRSPKEGPWRT